MKEQRTWIGRTGSAVVRLCAYRQVYRAVFGSSGKFGASEQIQMGRNIALLGLFCPLFWISLLSGAEPSTIALHGIHSGVVFLIGAAMLVFGLVRRSR